MKLNKWKKKSLSEFQETEIEKYEQILYIYVYTAYVCIISFASKLSKLYPWTPW